MSPSLLSWRKMVGLVRKLTSASAACESLTCSDFPVVGLSGHTGDPRGDFSEFGRFLFGSLTEQEEFDFPGNNVASSPVFFNLSTLIFIFFDGKPGIKDFSLSAVSLRSNSAADETVTLLNPGHFFSSANKWSNTPIFFSDKLPPFLKLLVRFLLPRGTSFSFVVSPFDSFTDLTLFEVPLVLIGFSTSVSLVLELDCLSSLDTVPPITSPAFALVVFCLLFIDFSLLWAKFLSTFLGVFCTSSFKVFFFTLLFLDWVWANVMFPRLSALLFKSVFSPWFLSFFDVSDRTFLFFFSMGLLTLPCCFFVSSRSSPSGLLSNDFCAVDVFLRVGTVFLDVSEAVDFLFWFPFCVLLTDSSDWVPSPVFLTLQTLAASSVFTFFLLRGKKRK